MTETMLNGTATAAHVATAMKPQPTHGSSPNRRGLNNIENLGMKNQQNEIIIGTTKVKTARIPTFFTFEINQLKIITTKHIGA
jgi:hypothetical protein